MRPSQSRLGRVWMFGFGVVAHDVFMRGELGYGSDDMAWIGEIRRGEVWRSLVR